MKKSGLLSKLKMQGRPDIIEPSEDVCLSYLIKADNCLRSSKILLANSLFENSVTEAYYAMYNSLLALLFKAGIKCENHAGSISLLELIFNRHDLSESIRKAKKERVDKQYYLSPDDPLMKESAEQMAFLAEDFIVKLKLIIKSSTSFQLNAYHVKFSSFYERL